MNNSQKKSQDLEERMMNFSISIITLAQKHIKVVVLRPIFIQLVRSSSSIGANYTEANNASSRADFRNKIFIAKKEAAETRYWLRILDKSLPEEDLSSQLDECTQFLFILQKIVSTLKSGK